MNENARLAEARKAWGMTTRLAVFSCPCCDAALTVPLAPRSRAPASRPCTNGGCWSCLGSCLGQATQVEVVAAA